MGIHQVDVNILAVKLLVIKAEYIYVYRNAYTPHYPLDVTYTQGEEFLIRRNSDNSLTIEGGPYPTYVTGKSWNYNRFSEFNIKKETSQKMEPFPSQTAFEFKTVYQHYSLYPEEPNTYDNVDIFLSDGQIWYENSAWYMKAPRFDLFYGEGGYAGEPVGGSHIRYNFRYNGADIVKIF